MYYLAQHFKSRHKNRCHSNVSIFFLQFLSFFIDFCSFETSVFTICTKFWPAGLLPECVFVLLKPFLRVPSFSNLLKSLVLWVVCAHPCLLHEAQLFAKIRNFFEMRSSFFERNLAFLSLLSPFSADLLLGFPVFFGFIGFLTFLNHLNNHEKTL